MVNVYDIWNKIMSGLNSISNDYLFIKANSIQNLPSYPYATVNTLVTYIQDRDDFRATESHSVNEDGTIKLRRTEEPQMTFSITVYSDNREEVFQILQDTTNWLTSIGKQYLSENDIILLGCSGYVDKTSILETEYVYKYGFDIRVRVKDIIDTNIDAIETVSVENTEHGENIEIEGGN